MRRSLSALCALVLSAGIVACGGSSKSSSTDSVPSNSDSNQSYATVDALKTAIAADPAATSWSADVTDLTLETWLGAPMLILHVGWDNSLDPTQRGLKVDAVRNGIDTYESPIAINMMILDMSGEYWFAGSSSNGVGAPMSTAFALPSAPTTADEVRAWLDAVYGPNGLVPLGSDELWFNSITSIAMDDLGYGPTLVVTTTLGAADRAQLLALQVAIQTTGSPLLTSFSVTGAGDYFSAGGASPSEPGAVGYFYPLAP